MGVPTRCHTRLLQAGEADRQRLYRVVLEREGSVDLRAHDGTDLRRERLDERRASGSFYNL